MERKSSELMRSDRYRKIKQNKRGKCERSGLNLELETWFWSEILRGINITFGSWMHAGFALGSLQRSTRAEFQGLYLYKSCTGNRLRSITLTTSKTIVQGQKAHLPPPSIDSNCNGTSRISWTKRNPSLFFRVLVIRDFIPAHPPGTHRKVRILCQSRLLKQYQGVSIERYDGKRLLDCLVT